MKPVRKILLVYMKPETSEGRKTLKMVRKVVKETGCMCSVQERNSVNLKDCKDTDLVITIGGDGTFLRAAQSVKDSLMLGINLDVKNKVGFFTRADRKDFGEKFKQALKGRFKVAKLPRIETRIGRKKVELALNEVYYGHKLPYKMCRYILFIDGRKEMQRSSGVLVGTGSGSHAWIRSAGGKPFNMRSGMLEYLVREPYQDFRSIKLRQGFIKPGQQARIRSRSSGNIVVVDALSKEYKIPPNTTVTIKPSNQPVSMVEF